MIPPCFFMSKVQKIIHYTLISGYRGNVMLSGIAAKTYDALARRLRKIDDRDDFVLGVIANAGTVENWQSIIEFIDNNPAEADYETVLAYSVLIDDMAEK